MPPGEVGVEVALIVEGDGTTCRLIAEVDPSAQVATLTAPLARELGLRHSDALGLDVERNGHTAAPSDTIADLELRHGDRVHLVADGSTRASQSSERTDQKAGLSLMLVGGPGSGSRFPLHDGNFVVGRDPKADIHIDDDSASRRHLIIRVEGMAATIEDLGSTNGTFVDGEHLGEPRVVEPGRVIEAGATMMALEGRRAVMIASHHYADGRVQFNRRPRVTTPFQEQRFEFPTAPERPKKPKFPMAASVVPVLLGVAMFLVLQQVIFLLFSAMGPIMAIWSLVDDRRSGRREFRDASSKYSADVDSLGERLSTARDAELLERRAAAPSAAHLWESAMSLAPDLWERRIGDEDFLELRIGLGDLPTKLALEVPKTGDPELRARAERLRTVNSRDPDVPVTLSLRALGVAGLAGPLDRTDDLLRWLVVQAATLHSPRDLAVIALVPEDRETSWSWLRWLPHTQTLVPGKRSVATDLEGVRALFEMVDELASTRGDATNRDFGGTAKPWIPHLLLVIPGDVAVSRSALAARLDSCTGVGFSAIVAARAKELLPGECRALIAPMANGDGLELTLTATGARTENIVADTLTADRAEGIAIALAPLRDVGARDAIGELPSRVDLLDLLGTESPDRELVIQRWASSRPGLAATIGLGRGGPVTLDLRDEGPHGLIAGTSGAGKSEFLQTLVISLAASYSPERVNFVLIDYKGGAAFKDCVDLPHTVGVVTDLDGHLAQRALISLEAELGRRERVLSEHATKDLDELETRAIESAPPRLVIVVDEFAFLKREVPEFVSGIVNVAQRGRSLGVHLLLATQRPTGVIDDQIRANSNLRIALRVSDDSESTDILERPDAARIPSALRGRAFARTGHGHVREVQVAYVGGRHGVTAKQAQVTLRSLDEPFRVRSAGGSPIEHPDSVTDLQRLARAIASAAAVTELQPLHRPWLPALERSYVLEPLTQEPARAGDSELSAPLGVVDEPDRQEQGVFALDLANAGNVLVYGTGGSGKTTLLRSMVAGLALRLSPDDLHIYGLDFASHGLRGLGRLPHCGGVVAANELERAERLFAMLDELVHDRRERLSRAGTASLVEYRQTTERLPFVIVVLDGYGSFQSVFEDVDHGALIDRLAQLVVNGRGVGIHFVIAAERRGAVPPTLAGLVTEQLVLRLADSDEYAWLGLGQAAKGADLPPGRCFVTDRREMQVAVLGGDPTGSAQHAALERLGHELRTRHPETVVPGVEPLADHVDLATLPAPAANSREVPIGIDGITLVPLTVNIDDVPTFLVVGPDRSGRSTALRTLTVGLRHADPDLPAYLASPRRSPLLDEPDWTEAARGIEACEQLVLRLAEEVQARSSAGESLPMLVVVDDGEELAEGRAAPALERLVRRGRDAGLLLVAAAQTHVVHRTFGGWLTDLRKAKQGLMLSPDIDIDGELFGVRLPRKSVATFPPGRGYLTRRGAVRLVQVAR